MADYRKTAARLLGTLGVLAGGVAACSHDVESPKVTLTQLEPDLICNDQFPEGGITVTLVGDGFTPMPIKAVEGPAAAELPSVSLARGRELDGTEATAEPIVFSGLANQPNADKLGWASDQSMSITFDESNQPEPGIYDVTVTQPDRQSKATKTNGLAIIPPPRVDSIVPTALCNGFLDQRFTANGDFFLKIGDAVPTIEFVGSGVDPFPADEMTDCVDIAGLSEPVQICKSVTTTVPAESLEPGEYGVIVHNPSQTDHVCSSTEQITVRVLNEGPVLVNADPFVVFNGISTQGLLYLTAVQGADPTVEIRPSGAAAGDGGAGGGTIELEASLVAGRNNRIQATIPADLAPGFYDVTVTDEIGCATTLTEGFEVVAEVNVTVTSISPPFGEAAVSNAITISLEADAPDGSPRAFLNPDTGPAIQLRSVTAVDARTLTAVVPADTPAGTYDLVIVWPTGEVAVFQDAYTSLTAPPPVIEDVAPQSVVYTAPQVITLTGTGFAGGDVTLRCQTATGSFVDLNPTETTEVCTAGVCTQTATVDADAAGDGAACVVRVTNADGSYGDFSAVATTNSSLNLAASPTAGTPLNTARRAPVSAGVRASAAARFVYAIGGDDGATSGALGSVEFSPIDIFGTMNPWVDAPTALTTPRTFAGITTIGRYIYVIGGNGGAGSLGSAERAVVLSPDEIPEISNIDLCLSGGGACFGGTAGDAGFTGGLATGLYSYRVAAVISPTDPVNLGGETLASDPIILRLRDIGDRSVIVRLEWTAPTDALGADLSGIIGYRIYRTPVDGTPGTDELLLEEIGNELTYTDDGSATPGAARPLPQGSTSAWQALPALGAPRTGPGAAAAQDPATPSTWYVYALQGHTDGAALASYELLTVTITPNGRQTVGAAWTPGTEASSVGRSSHGAYRVDNRVLSSLPPGESHIYVVSGSTGAAAETDVSERAQVQAGGQLAAFTLIDPMSPMAGFGAVAVGSSNTAKLFVFGGTDGTPTDVIMGGTITTPPLAFVNWNNEGAPKLTTPRAFMGAALQSANIFLVGGTSSGTNALATTERVVW